MSETLQDELRGLFANARMPTNPSLAARILELARESDSTADQFAELIQTDSSLATRLLRMANSAAYGLCQQVKTIPRAVSLLGVNRVRTVSLGFQLVAHLDRLGGCPFDMRRFWQQSLLRGCLAREFATAVCAPRADEAFLVGLLQDCGIVLLVQLLGEPYALLCREEGLSPSSFFAEEKRHHRYNHPQVAAALAREWKLPETFVTLVEKHHLEPPLGPSRTEEDLLWDIAYLAGSVRLTASSSIAETEPALSQFARQHLNLDTETVTTCLLRAGEAYAEVGCVLHSALPDDLDVTDLLSQANVHLTMGLEAEQLRSVEERAHLASALGEYRERAARDPLTGLLNRGALNEAIRNGLEQARYNGDTITLLFVDLDDFKALNDTQGHRVGDEILKCVAARLRDCTPNNGTAGRYGGEEFLVLVPGLDETEARSLSVEALAALRCAQLPGLALPRSVTSSLGAIWGEPDKHTTAEDLIQAADELMYQAKRSGKNRCCFRKMDGLYDVDLLESDSAAVAACASTIIADTTRGIDKATVPKAFRRIARQLNRSTPRRLLDRRKNQRKELIIPCRLTALTATTSEFEDAYVRNISTGGIGILTTMTVRRGQPLEVALLVGDEPRLFVAGLVAFCRDVEEVVHDVGVQLFMHSKQPILSQDAVEAIHNLDWVAQALWRGRDVTAASA